MASCTLLTQYYTNLPRRKSPPLSKIPIFFATVTTLLVVLYISFTFDTFLLLTKNISSPYLSRVDQPPLTQIANFQQPNKRRFTSDDENNNIILSSSPLLPSVYFSDPNGPPETLFVDAIDNSTSNVTVAYDEDNFVLNNNSVWSTNTIQEVPLLLPELELTLSNNGKTYRSNNNNNEEDAVYHDEEIFLENYKEMKKTLKIYIYPHKKNDPFAHALLPVKGGEPRGNYASESYFKIELFKSHFITTNPSEADFFYLPFSIARLRHDKRVSVGGIADFILNYMKSVTQNYPYWNRTGGSDHFYAACHSISKLATDKVHFLKSNAIQVVCSSSYFLANYYTHKDICLPQIWPRHDDPPQLASTSQRKKLAFYAGTGMSPVRKFLVKTWGNDSSISVHGGRLKTSYSEQLLRSKYCLHVKGFEVNTARIGDAMYYGCVPVIIADYYDLPFMDILNWKSFSVVITSSDIPNLKNILKSISSKRYSVLQANVLKVRKHFQWHTSPVDFDAFHMTMYELWLRRSSVKVMF